MRLWWTTCNWSNIVYINNKIVDLGKREISLQPCADRKSHLLWVNLYFQKTQVISYIMWSNIIHSLKYLRSTTLDFKDIGTTISEFVAKTHFLSGFLAKKCPHKIIIENILSSNLYLSVCMSEHNSWNLWQIWNHGSVCS